MSETWRQRAQDVISQVSLAIPEGVTEEKAARKILWNNYPFQSRSGFAYKYGSRRWHGIFSGDTDQKTVPIKKKRDVKVPGLYPAQESLF